jgi:hypothetical protein
VSALFIVRAVDNKDEHKRTSSHYLTFVDPDHLHYGQPLLTNKRYFRILKHISEGLKSVAVKNLDTQVRGFAAFEKRKPPCPARILEKFGDMRRILEEDPDILNYENAQVLLLDARKKDVQEENWHRPK